MFGLGRLLTLLQEWGAVMVLAAIALLILMGVARRFWHSQGHDANLAGNTAGIYQQMVQDQRIRLAHEEKRNSDLQTALIQMAQEGNAAHRAEVTRMSQQHTNDIARLELKYEGLLSDMSKLREDCERRDSARSRENAALWSVTTAEQRLALSEQGITPTGIERRVGKERRGEHPEIKP